MEKQTSSKFSSYMFNIRGRGVPMNSWTGGPCETWHDTMKTKRTKEHARAPTHTHTHSLTHTHTHTHTHQSAEKQMAPLSTEKEICARESHPFPEQGRQTKTAHKHKLLAPVRAWVTSWTPRQNQLMLSARNPGNINVFCWLSQGQPTFQKVCVHSLYAFFGQPAAITYSAVRNSYISHSKTFWPRPDYRHGSRLPKPNYRLTYLYFPVTKSMSVTGKQLRN